jgi:hypothetical protein
MILGQLVLLGQPVPGSLLSATLKVARRGDEDPGSSTLSVSAPFRWEGFAAAPLPVLGPRGGPALRFGLPSATWDL